MDVDLVLRKRVFVQYTVLCIPYSHRRRKPSPLPSDSMSFHVSSIYPFVNPLTALDNSKTSALAQLSSPLPSTSSIGICPDGERLD